MARIRSIKPEFWTDEKVVELSAFARLLFIGLWNFADDEGRMVYSEKQIKLRILPADNVEISELLGEIRRKELATVYEVDGVQYLQVNGFAKHQKVDKRTPSKLPPPPPKSSSSVEPRRIPPPDQGKDQGREGIKDSASLAPDGADLDLKSVVFDGCLSWLARATKKNPNTVRSLMGKWLRDYGEGRVIEVIGAAQRTGPVEPIGWIESALKRNGAHRGKPPPPVTPLGVGG